MTSRPPRYPINGWENEAADYIRTLPTTTTFADLCKAYVEYALDRENIHGRMVRDQVSWSALLAASFAPDKQIEVVVREFTRYIDDVNERYHGIGTQMIQYMCERLSDAQLFRLYTRFAHSPWMRTWIVAEQQRLRTVPKGDKPPPIAVHFPGNSNPVSGKFRLKTEEEDDQELQQHMAAHAAVVQAMHQERARQVEEQRQFYLRHADQLARAAAAHAAASSSSSTAQAARSISAMRISK